MSSISPTAAATSQAYTPPASSNRADVAKAADQTAAKVAELTATAVAAESSKDLGKVVDIQV